MASCRAGLQNSSPPDPSQVLIGPVCLWEVSMAAAGPEVTGSWFLSSGLIGLFVVLLLLSIFLTALCSDCRRHSFELQDAKAEKNPPALIRVVKLEEVKVNPLIGEIQKDEKDPVVSFTPAESQQGALQTLPEPTPAEGTWVHVPPWRSHLVAPPSRDLNGSAPQASDHIDHAAGDGRGNETLSTSANQLSTQLHYIARPDDKNSLYARVSKKLRLTDSSAPTPEEAGPQVEEEEPRGQHLPPLRTWMENRVEGGSMFVSK